MKLFNFLRSIFYVYGKAEKNRDTFLAPVQRYFSNGTCGSLSRHVFISRPYTSFYIEQQKN